MKAYASSDIGKQRSSNQDSFEIKTIQNLNFYVVADGMGGHQGGEIASNLSISSFFEYIEQRKEYYETKDIGDLLAEAVEHANSEVFIRAAENYETKRMGTTFTVLCIKDEMAYVSHIGDSRLYLLREGALIQKTVDHTYANELLLAGHITEKEAERSLKKHILTRALGTDAFLEIDNYVMRLKQNDKILICSDGLTNMVEMNEMKEIIVKNEIELAVNKLIDRANFYGGQDNITVILVEIGGEQ